MFLKVFSICSSIVLASSPVLGSQPPGEEELHVRKKERGEGGGRGVIALPGAFNPVVYADCLAVVVFL